jgi:hypothetical protein
MSAPAWGGRALTGTAAARAQTASGGFLTEPGWNVSPIVVSTPAAATVAPGAIFVAPTGLGVTTIPLGVYGPLILDNAGDPIWFRPLATEVAQNFRVQSWRGQDVLTWYEGSADGTYGGSCVIYDSAYRELKRVYGGDGLSCDLHEFLITSRDTALISIYNEVTADLSSIGGPSDGRVVEGIVQELDLERERVLFEWHSLDHVALDESYRTGLTAAGNVDYFHLNAIAVDSDDNLLISARHTSTVYKLDRTSGAIIWRLGGMKNDFQMGTGAGFNFQHDARGHADGTLTLFDNGATGTGDQDVEPASRPLRLRVDQQALTAELVQLYETADPRLAIALGDVQQQPNTNVFVGWGAAGPFSEFDANGNVLFDASFGDGSVSYRALRFPWVGRPDTVPAIAAVSNGDGTMTVSVSWNGATEVASWQVRTGEGPGSLHPAQTAPRSGFETALSVPAAAYAAVAALDASGATLAVSQPLAV